METDAEIKQLVEAELRWRPELDEAEIIVAVNRRIVTLSGIARSFAEKLVAAMSASTKSTLPQTPASQPRSSGCANIAIGNRHSGS